MLQTLKARLAQDRKHDGGFTLIELMVVVLIIAILLAIAIPTFLGAQNKAKDRSAQSSLRNSVVAAKSIFTDTQTYASADATALKAGEPELTFQAAASADPKVVSISSTGTDTFVAAAYSKSGTCFYVKDIATGATAGTTYGSKAGTACSPADTGVTFNANW